jgi:hypothetical protein
VQGFAVRRRVGVTVIVVKHVGFDTFVVDDLAVVLFLLRTLHGHAVVYRLVRTNGEVDVEEVVVVVVVVVEVEIIVVFRKVNDEKVVIARVAEPVDVVVVEVVEVVVEVVEVVDEVLVVVTQVVSLQPQVSSAKSPRFESLSKKSH